MIMYDDSLYIQKLEKENEILREKLEKERTEFAIYKSKIRQHAYDMYKDISSTFITNDIALRRLLSDLNEYTYTIDGDKKDSNNNELVLVIRDIADSHRKFIDKNKDKLYKYVAEEFE